MTLNQPEFYNLVQFFEDGSHEYVRRLSTLSELEAPLKHYTNNVATRMGVVTRVIITDMDDHTCFEWVNGKGITFPKGEGIDD